MFAEYKLGSNRTIFSNILANFFVLLYGPLAWAYDYVAALVSFGSWKVWVLSISPYLEEGKNILEIGFGTGHLLESMAERGISCIGLDASGKMCQISTRRLHNRGINCDLVNGASQNTPFPDNYFHTVVMTFPADFVHQASTWSEISRVMKTGGVVYLLPFVRFRKPAFISWMVERFPKLSTPINDTSSSFDFLPDNFTWEAILETAGCHELVIFRGEKLQSTPILFIDKVK